MGAAENKKLIRDTFSKWVDGDGGAFFNLLADDVKWTVIGTTAVSRTYASKKEFVDGAVKPLGEKINGAIKPALRDIIAEGDNVVLQWEGRAAGKNGAAYEQTYCWVMRIENGKVQEGTAYLNTEMITKLWK
ncbi:MAG: nuclear transport factor 2 family protein [Candidatus Binataceae bacterium]